MINRFNNPFYDMYSYGDEDDGYYASPHTYESLRRQRLYEEEQLRRQRLAKITQQRRLQQALEEERREREYAKYLQQQRAAHLQQLRQQKQRTEVDDDDASVYFRTVRGPDGMLYRIPVVEKKPKTETLMRGPDGRLYRVVRNHNESDVSVASSTDDMSTSSGNNNKKKILKKDVKVTEGKNGKTATSTVKSSAPVEIKIVTGSPSSSNNNKGDNKATEIKIATINNDSDENVKSRRQKVTVLVEDASDSEDEQDEWRSVWRHRKPSPNESWMEPVAGMN